ncbi:hypothetical protein PPYR_12971 [Photinus pyralis]|uniref:FAD-binding domain-containing protein n=1 Tax=Photinus pyralis TaxID=7054 RepID=A0A5N4A7P6_PHOPY|nr:kynurenine 3-monooxygenase-like [Photinus pyralis]XP_031353800.1 kynurenine 3-monooxygenase-like [Photinus pyralis]XP_031353801.1 kynurenine 3-monooxygenase-like [Photinus pyralis]KAB0793351.1 hypothetical protein PPYR_12971 [Photinus pyralis]
MIGDAAHVMVPFFGQGLNAGFEDVTILNEILNSCEDDIPKALETFTERRRNDCHAISDLSLYNYVELRDLTTRPSFHLRKFIDDSLFRLFPSYWLPLYQSVSFTNLSYEKCARNRRRQDTVILATALTILVVAGELFARFVMFLC